MQTSGHTDCLEDRPVLYTVCDNICFYYTSQVLERLVHLYTYAIYIFMRDYDLAVCLAMYKAIY